MGSRAQTRHKTSSIAPLPVRVQNGTARNPHSGRFAGGALARSRRFPAPVIVRTRNRTGRGHARRSDAWMRPIERRCPRRSPPARLDRAERIARQWRPFPPRSAAMPDTAQILYTLTDEGAVPRHRLVPADRAGVRGHRGRGRRHPRHLAGRAHPRAVPGPARRAGGRRRPGRTRRAGEDPAGQHHQAAQHQRVDPAAEGGDRRTPGARLRPARLPGRTEDRPREGT